MSETLSLLPTTAKVVGGSAIACAIIGAISAIVPLPVITGALMGIFACLAWFLYLNIKAGKLIIIIIALVSAALNIVAMWYVWIAIQYDLDTANYVLLGGPDAFSAFWDSLISTQVSIRNIDISDYMRYSAYASTFAMAFPPLVWGLFSTLIKGSPK